MRVFATCPQSKDDDPSGYRNAIARVSRWSEAAGCFGILVYTDNGIVDPWLVSQLVIESTDRLVPLVAVQPVYLHPYSAAKAVTSLAFLHGRAVALNVLAGGFKNDLASLGDETPHDERYERTVEYTRIVMALLRGGPPVTHHGRHYRVTNLKLAPPLPAGLVPDVLISGSSEAGLAAARALGATPVRYPRPAAEELPQGAGGEFGVRVGIIARPTAEVAWTVAHDRFPPDRAGQVAHRLARSVSDSHWVAQLSGHNARGERPTDAERDVYWLGPFQNYQTFCPYLVGAYDQVADELARYLELGSTTFILDIPASQEELEHIGLVLERAERSVTPA